MNGSNGSVSRSREKVRHLDADDLGVSPEVSGEAVSLLDRLTRIAAPTPIEEARIEVLPNTPADTLLPVLIDEEDELVKEVRQLLADGYAGVIFRGPPGTSKSWYAAQIGALLVDRNPERIRFIQFHPSYQYEDFVEGFVPSKEGTFKLRRKHFLQICKAAENNPDLHVLVIDEMSRVDPSRVFGEALTYIEMSRRSVPFRLASGRVVSVPKNLVFLATMNVLDRGVDEVDAAVERRFASIEMNPDIWLLTNILEDNKVAPELLAKIIRFFETIQRDPNPACHIGHAYFRLVKDEETLRRLWTYQLKSLFQKAFPLGDDGYRRIEKSWDKLFVPRPEGASAGNGTAVEAP